MTFRKILDRLGLDIPVLPLWKLKVTDEEYEELKKELRESSLAYREFNTCKSEALLYYAEWWRREYEGGTPSKEMIFENLFHNTSTKLSNTDDVAETLFKAALSAAERYGVEVLQVNTNQPFFSILYQGGFPLHYILNNPDRTKNWVKYLHQRITGTVNEADYPGNFPKTAINSLSLKDFCERMYEANRTADLKGYPFYCPSQDYKLHLELVSFINQSEREERETNPFSIKWICHLDRPGKQIQIKAKVSVPKVLNSDFILQHDLSGKSNIDLQIIKGINSLYQISYQDRIIRKKQTEFYIDYHFEDGRITIAQPATFETDLVDLCHDTLDLSVPHLFHEVDSLGNFSFGRALGRLSKSAVLLVPEKWDIIGDHSFEIFKYDEEEYKVLFLDSQSDLAISLRNELGDVMNVSYDSTFFWTEAFMTRPQSAWILTELHSLDNTIFYKCSDSLAKRRVELSSVMFRTPYSNQWCSEAPVGRIFARIADPDLFVTETSLINTGTPIKVRIISSDADTTKIDIQWDKGKLTSLDGVYVDNGNDRYWKFEKSSQKSSIAVFNCCPYEGSNFFKIKLLIPYKEVKLYDGSQMDVPSGSCLPLEELETYSYHINVGNISVDINDRHALNIQSFNDLIVTDNEIRRSFPSASQHGSLINIFGNRSNLERYFNRMADPSHSAHIKVTLKWDQDKKFIFYVYRFPFKFQQLEISEDERKIGICNRSGWNVDVPATLTFFSFDNIDLTPVQISKEDGIFHIPNIYQEYGPSLLIGTSAFSPSMEDFSKNDKLSGEERIEIQKGVVERLETEISHLSFSSPLLRRCACWMSRCSSYGIPYSSICDFKVLTKEKYLVIFAYYMFLRSKFYMTETEEELISALLGMEDDLDFQWFWLFKSNNYMMILSDFINESLGTEEFLRIVKIKSILEDKDIDAETLKNNQIPFVSEVMVLFDSFMKKLFLSSLKISFPEENDVFSKDNIDLFFDGRWQNIVTLDITNANFNDTSDPLSNEIQIINNSPLTNIDWPEDFDKYTKNATTNIEYFCAVPDLLSEHLAPNGSKCSMFDLSENVRRIVIYNFRQYPLSFFSRLCKK